MTKNQSTGKWQRTNGIVKVNTTQICGENEEGKRCGKKIDDKKG